VTPGSVVGITELVFAGDWSVYFLGWGVAVKNRNFHPLLLTYIYIFCFR